MSRVEQRRETAELLVDQLLELDRESIAYALGSLASAAGSSEAVYIAICQAVGGAIGDRARRRPTSAQ